MKNLRKLRLKAGLTQVQLVQKTGFSRSKIQRHEAGERISPEDVNWYRGVFFGYVDGEEHTLVYRKRK